MIRLVDSEWEKEMRDALASAGGGVLRIICPFIKLGALEWILAWKPEDIRVITRFNLKEFAEGASDIAALRKLSDVGARVRGIRHLHAKMYLFGSSRAIVTSANLTESGLGRNHEFGVVVSEESLLADCRKYFDSLWRQGEVLIRDNLGAWEKRTVSYLELREEPAEFEGLGDYGAEVGGVVGIPVQAPVAPVEVPQAFVKFFGTGTYRIPLSFKTIDKVKHEGCHRFLSYPAGRSPSKEQAGTVMFISYMTKNPRDIRIFGRAVVVRAYVPGLDDAKEEDKNRRPWKKAWSRYLRVRDAEFVDGTMANGVSLYAMMEELKSDSFESTQLRATQGERDINPRDSLRRPSAKLSPEGFAWIEERLQRAFERHGRIPAEHLNFE